MASLAVGCPPTSQRSKRGAALLCIHISLPGAVDARQRRPPRAQVRQASARPRSAPGGAGAEQRGAHGEHAAGDGAPRRIRGAGGAAAGAGSAPHHVPAAYPQGTPAVCMRLCAQWGDLFGFGCTRCRHAHMRPCIHGRAQEDRRLYCGVCPQDRWAAHAPAVAARQGQPL